jgi:hypothetical protein
MMEAEDVCEASVFNSTRTRLIAQDHGAMIEYDMRGGATKTFSWLCKKATSACGLCGSREVGPKTEVNDRLHDTRASPQSNSPLLPLDKRPNESKCRSGRCRDEENMNIII